jgi:hypothetical protein
MTPKLTELLKVELQDRPLRRMEGSDSAPNRICGLVSIAGSSGDPSVCLEAMAEARRILTAELDGADLKNPSPRAKRACESWSISTNSVKHREFVNRGKS